MLPSSLGLLMPTYRGKDVIIISSMYRYNEGLIHVNDFYDDLHLVVLHCISVISNSFDFSVFSFLHLLLLSFHSGYCYSCNQANALTSVSRMYMKPPGSSSSKGAARTRKRILRHCNPAIIMSCMKARAPVHCCRRHERMRVDEVESRKRAWELK